MNRRREILDRMGLVMGPVPGDDRRVPLDVRLVDEHIGPGGVALRKLTFAVEPGDRCPAWLLSPRETWGGTSATRPAVLCLHQTTPIGKDEPAGLSGQPNLHYALELAQRGFVTLAPDYPNLGAYRVDPYLLGYASATMKGIWNHMRAIDLLASLPGVDSARIGCVGHSLGGHNALFLTAFDPRVRAAASSCGFTGFAWNRNDGAGEPGDVSDWSHEGYMPLIRDRYGARAEQMPFDWDEVLEAIAPRAVFINAPEQDMFAAEGVRACIERVRPLYEQAAAADRLVLRHPNCGHDFPADVRAEAYDFLGNALGLLLARELQR